MNRIDIVIEDLQDYNTLGNIVQIEPSNRITVVVDGQPQIWMGRVTQYDIEFGESSTSDGIAEVTILGEFGRLELNTRHIAVNVRAPRHRTQVLDTGKMM